MTPLRRRQQIAAIAYQNKRELYGILFRATAQTLLTIAADPKHLGAEIGFFAVLHTWGQNLLHHPHLHCVVAGGGLSADGSQWISCRNGFFLPVGVLSRLFRRLFLEYLLRAFDAGKLGFFSSLESLRHRCSFLDYLAAFSVAAADTVDQNRLKPCTERSSGLCRVGIESRNGNPGFRSNE
jgi:hypothetical protein